ncbi:MAG: hypothetical protein RL660_53 [Bacteroidota bacterium]|jgi:regulator of sirC expression with transglutaminase-like and TPR domain
MQETSEIKALLHLLDDPDSAVYDTVKSRLLSYGKEVIPNLQDAWEQTTSQDLQQRIEDLIHEVSYECIVDELQLWLETQDKSLVDALIICSKYRYQDVDDYAIRKQIKEIRQSIWLELNQYLTPLEQATVISSIMYSYYRFTYEDPTTERFDCCFINNALHSKVGSSYILGMIILDLCKSLDINLVAVNMPNVFLLAYVDRKHVFFAEETETESTDDFIFYMDPSSGTIFSQSDVEAYLKKNDYSNDPQYYKILDNTEVLALHLKHLVQLYGNGEIINTREKELLKLIDLIRPDSAL